MKISRFNTACSNETVDIEQIIKWGRSGQGPYIELLQSVALWQLAHPGEAKVIHRTDEELLKLLPNGVDEKGCLRVYDNQWLSPTDLQKAIDNPVVFNYLLTLANNGDSRCGKILDENDAYNKSYINSLADYICLSQPLNSLDFSDINRIVLNRKYQFGMKITFTGDSFPECLLHFCDKTNIVGTKMSGLILYIETSLCNTVAELNMRLSSVLKHLINPAITEGVDTAIGYGHPDIEQGCLRLTLIAGYD